MEFPGIRVQCQPQSAAQTHEYPSEAASVRGDTRGAEIKTISEIEKTLSLASLRLMAYCRPLM